MTSEASTVDVAPAKSSEPVKDSLKPASVSDETAVEELDVENGKKSPVTNAQSIADEKQLEEPPNKKRRCDSTDELRHRDWREKRDSEGFRPRDRYEGEQYYARDRKRYNKSKFDPSSQPESSDPDEIRKQVEFYFSDSNLLIDKFLLGETQGSANEPVPIKVIHNFKRMRHFQPYSAVVAALKTSKTLNITDDEKIQRKIPLPEGATVNPRDNVSVYEDISQGRSIYAKGFGQEQSSTQYDIEAFFAPYGPLNAIRLRRASDKYFKGSVFVEFDSDETAQAFLALDPKPKWEGKDLKIMSKEDYDIGKAEDTKAGRIQPNSNRARDGFADRGRGPYRCRGHGRGHGRGAYRNDRNDAREHARTDRRERRENNDDHSGQNGGQGFEQKTEPAKVVVEEKEQHKDAVGQVQQTVPTNHSESNVEAAADTSSNSRKRSASVEDAEGGDGASGSKRLKTGNGEAANENANE